MHCPDRFGFTLLELIAALTLTGFAILGGILLIDQLGDGATRIEREGRRMARDANGERLLGRLLLDAMPNTDSTKRFRGDEQSVDLWTSCDAPGGWLVPCGVTLAIDRRGDSSVVLGELSTGEALSLRRFAGAAELRYVDASASNDTVWRARWSSNITLPAAVGIVLPADTVVYPVSVSR